MHHCLIEITVSTISNKHILNLGGNDTRHNFVPSLAIEDDSFEKHPLQEIDSALSLFHSRKSKLLFKDNTEKQFCQKCTLSQLQKKMAMNGDHAKTASSADDSRNHHSNTQKIFWLA